MRLAESQIEEAIEWAQKEAYSRGWQSMQVYNEPFGGKDVIILDLKNEKDAPYEEVERFLAEVMGRFPKIWGQYDHPDAPEDEEPEDWGWEPDEYDIEEEPEEQPT